MPLYGQFLLGVVGMEGRPESLSVGMGTKLLAGGAAGITAASTTYPLDLVRTRLAAQVQNCWDPIHLSSGKFCTTEGG